MANTDFRPAAGNFGEVYLGMSRTLPTAVITAAGTVRHFLPLVASEVTATSQTELLYYKDAGLVFGSTASSTAGAVTARIVKRNSGGTITPMSAAVTIPTGTGTGSILAFPLLSGVTDDVRTVRPNAGDTVAVEITQAGGGTVTTQPVDVQVAVKFAVLR